MRKTLAFLAMASILSVPALLTPSASAAQRYAQGRVSTHATYRERSAAEETALFPTRVVAGAAWVPIGALGGMAKRTGNAVEWVNKKTFRQAVGKHDRMTDRPGKTLGRGLFLVPAGIVGTAAALPVGVGIGGVEGSIRGFGKGFTWPERSGH